MGYAEAQYTVDELLAHLDRTEGSGIPPSTMECSVRAGVNLSINCYFAPMNTVINGATLCLIKGVRIVINHVHIPENIYDGEIIIDSVDDAFAHSSNPLVVSVPEEGDWYIRFFPYSDQNVYNYSDEHKFQVTVSTSIRIAAFHQDFTNLDPTTSITYFDEDLGFVPMMTNASNGDITYGDWMDRWPWLQKIRPYMVNYDGTVDYALNPNDYTKKEDGSESDVSNLDYQGAGAFVWIPRLYTKNVQDGATSRTVYFSEEKIDDDYKAYGFIDRDGNEMLGVWLPMFFTSSTFKSVAGSKEFDFVVNKTQNVGVMTLIPSNEGTPASYTQYDYLKTQSAIKAYFDSLFGTKRYAYFGGALIDVLRDVLYLLYKSPNIPFNGGSYPAPKSVSGYKGFQSEIVNGGIFYGQNRTSSDGYHNKFFHSIILGGYRNNYSSVVKYGAASMHLFMDDPMTFLNTPYNVNEPTEDSGLYRATRYLEVNEPGDVTYAGNEYNMFIRNNKTTGLLEKIALIYRATLLKNGNTCYTPLDTTIHPMMIKESTIGSGSTTTGLCNPAQSNAFNGLSTLGSGKDRQYGTFTLGRCAGNYIGTCFGVVLYDGGFNGYNICIAPKVIMLLPTPGYSPI